MTARLVIAATCAVHGGATGFTNIVIRKVDGEIEIDPHADGSCVLTLDEDAAAALFDALGRWLG
ncbi:MAG: hypothetical protein ACRDR6_25590 [Pseudonocardiaceae bacterium]